MAADLLPVARSGANSHAVLPPAVGLPAPVRLKLELDGAGWLFHVKARAVSLAVADAENYTFDLEGRPYAAYVGGRNYRCGLDGRILAKFREEEAAAGDRPAASARQRRFLDAAARAGFLAQVRGRVGQLAAAVRARGLLAQRPAGPWTRHDGRDPGAAPASGGARAGGSLPEALDGTALRAWLERLGRWDDAALEAQVDRFHSVYRTVSILPPDQYMALVIQSSEGCPWNRCSFCGLYRDRRFRLKTPSELAVHLDQVVGLLGAGLRLRRSVFLGDANLLHASAERLLETLHATARTLRAAGGPAGPFFGFAGAVAALRHGRAELGALRQAGLQRVYLGLETGHDPLLALLRKPGRSRQMVEAVVRLRAAGIRTGVIVLLGIGGRQYAAAHEQDTVAALREMGLGRGDIVYFSPLVAHPELPYGRDSTSRGWAPLDAVDMRRQQVRMEDQLAYPPGAPLTSLYDIRDFVY